MRVSVHLSQVGSNLVFQEASARGISASEFVLDLIAQKLDIHVEDLREYDPRPRAKELVLVWLKSCPRRDSLTVPASIFHETYSQWVTMRKEVPVSIRRFREILIDAGLVSFKRSSGQFWQGVGLPTASARSDTLQQGLEEWLELCSRDPSDRVSWGPFYSAYAEHCKKHEVPILDPDSVVARLKTLGCQCVRQGPTKIWLGIAVPEQAGTAPDVAVE